MSLHTLAATASKNSGRSHVQMHTVDVNDNNHGRNKSNFTHNYGTQIPSVSTSQASRLW